jgi:2-polyprenyl-3-methyl-5-hydroxy-6-metoxy-1,4-benzoquinol methylase
MENKTHWEKVFATKTETEVSWYQPYPQTSIDFIVENKLPLNARIIDVGGGDSYLIDALLDLGYTNLYLLDISENAINRAKTRLANKSKNVTFIISDILDFSTENLFDYWHDRASFHFLTTTNQIQKYAEIVSQSIAENGKMMIATFNENGPKKCSGLDITQYNDQKIKAVFEPRFKLTSSIDTAHKTPFETLQNFIFCEFQKC